MTAVIDLEWKTPFILNYMKLCFFQCLLHIPSVFSFLLEGFWQSRMHQYFCTMVMWNVFSPQTELSHKRIPTSSYRCAMQDSKVLSILSVCWTFKTVQRLSCLYAVTSCSSVFLEMSLFVHFHYAFRLLLAPNSMAGLASFHREAEPESCSFCPFTHLLDNIWEVCSYCYHTTELLSHP